MTNDKLYDIIIIGGGPAGCAAAVYAARKKMSSLLITDDWGGQSVVSVDVQNWIGTPHITGPDIARQLQQHTMEYAGDILDIVHPARTLSITHNTHFEVKASNDKTYKSHAIILCSGSRRRTLDVEGAERLNHKGVSYCASCDAPLFSGVPVAVIGGGNAGFEGALQLLEHATSVVLLEKNSTFVADQTTQDSVIQHPNFSSHTEVTITAFLGDKKVEGLRYKDKAGQEHTLELGGIFVEIGSIPNSESVRDLVDTNQIGEVIVDPATQRASIPGFWAAGDVADGRFKQNNISMGDAVKALEDAYLYVQKQKV